MWGWVGQGRVPVDTYSLSLQTFALQSVSRTRGRKGRREGGGGVSGRGGGSW